MVCENHLDDTKLMAYYLMTLSISVNGIIHPVIIVITDSFQGSNGIFHVIPPMRTSGIISILPLFIGIRELSLPVTSFFERVRRPSPIVISAGTPIIILFRDWFKLAVQFQPRPLFRLPLLDAKDDMSSVSHTDQYTSTLTVEQPCLSTYVAHNPITCV